MNRTQLIKELRELTLAGMNDCKEAIEHAQGDLQKAIDFIKTKGLNIADARSGKVAAEGMVICGEGQQFKTLLEVNSQTDFTAKSQEFLDFAKMVSEVLTTAMANDQVFQHDAEPIETARKKLMSQTKENIVVRRWWVEQALSPNARVFSYVHSNSKIGVLLTLLAPSAIAREASEFMELGNNLAMQIAAMNPLAISPEHLSAEEVERQTQICKSQLEAMNKPPASWPKILEGKMNKWHQGVCLLNQEAVWTSKTAIQQAIDQVSKIVGGTVQVINFVRCQVGEGITVEENNLAQEVAKLM